MAARKERGLLDPNAAEGDSPFDHRIFAICSDGDIEEGVSAEASAIAGGAAARQPHRHLRRQPDLDRGQHRHRAGRGRRGPLRGLRLARADGRLDPRRDDVRRGRPGALRRASARRDAVTDRPSFIVLRTIIAWPAPDAQNTGKAHGSALGDEEVAATKKVLGFDPDQTFEIQPGVLEHTRELVARGKAEQQAWDSDFKHWTTKPSADLGALRPDADPHPAAGLGRRPADVRRRSEGGGHPQGVRRRSSTPSPRRCRSSGAARPTWPSPTTPPSRAPPSFLPSDRSHQDVAGRPVRRAGAALRHPRARHGRDPQRHRRARRHPRLRRHLPDVLRLHAPAPCGWPR